MTLSCASVRIYPRDGRFAAPDGFRSAVSLHSHSDRSRETLEFVPSLARSIPMVATLFARTLAGYERQHGRALDFAHCFWRPPLTPAAVVASERHHLEQRLDRPALVSLTDHDTIEGPRTLRAGRTDMPLSVEWSVPFEKTVFHLGVHAIPPARVDEAERVFASYTARGEGDLGAVFDWLVECPETFIVLNHPCWDMPGIGSLQHDSLVLTFLRRYRDRIHGLELNGYRSWNENRRVLPLAEGFGLPVVGGGDRHGLSPNTIVNLTAATCLGEFARDLRAGRSTSCVIFPEYLQPFAGRLLTGAAEWVTAVNESGAGRTWSDCVFATIDGADIPLSAVWTRAPGWVRTALGLTQLLGSNTIQRLYRLAEPGMQRAVQRDVSPEPTRGGAPFEMTLGPAAGVGDSF